jgi:hypothetical protein
VHELVILLELGSDLRVPKQACKCLVIRRHLVNGHELVCSVATDTLLEVGPLHGIAFNGDFTKHLDVDTLALKCTVYCRDMHAEESVLGQKVCILA